jgi:glycosyltransferase involved in cell wall biosynthesis
MSSSSRRKKSVSILVPDLSRGGMTRAYWLAKVVKSLGHDVEILGRLKPGQPIYPIPPANIPVRPIEQEGFFTLTRTLSKKIDGQVIYAIKPRLLSYGIALWHRLWTGTPVILDIDDWEFSIINPQETQNDQNRKRRSLREWVWFGKSQLRRFANPNDSRYIRWMENWTPKADAITVNSRFLHQLFGGHHIPNGKDTSLFNPQRFNPEVSRKKLKLQDNLVLMFPGTPLPHKGLEDVLVAIDKLGYPNLRVVLVGGRRTDFTEYLLKNWPRRILQLPRYPLDAMPEIISAAHVLVIAQRNTPMARAQVPMKLTDGMAMAKPILSTRIGDIPEILGDTGYLVEAGQPDCLAEKLEWILTHQKEAMQKGFEARKRCVEHYSLETVSLLMAKVLEPLTE